ncbi:hypothetical protein E2C01_030912 [Portunus trituberculatus]|uniref:Uncharacterized protein n=1 Tax=Portunus trituberculatus TaxID=210409 RepID=A0A5B7EYN2_PORTR|nr:hypothetical protein [Portunus trituberculatus]
MLLVDLPLPAPALSCLLPACPLTHWAGWAGGNLESVSLQYLHNLYFLILFAVDLHRFQAIQVFLVDRFIFELLACCL